MIFNAMKITTADEITTKTKKDWYHFESKKWGIVGCAMRTNNNGACDAPYKTELKIRAECEERRKIMLTLNIDYEVLPDRLVTFKLPETVRPGRHELVIVLEERPSQPERVKVLVETHNADKLNDLIKKRY